MAIQPFAMQVETANVMLPSEAMAGAERLKGLRQQNAMTDMEMADKQNLDRAYRESGGDINAMVSNPNLGFDAGTKLQSLSAENVKAQAAAKAANIDQQLKMLDAGAQVIGGANDQASWDAARQQMADMFGPEAAQRIPEQYDPNAQRTMMEQSMSFKDKLELQRMDIAQQKADQSAAYQNSRLDQFAQGLALRGQAADGGGDGMAKPKNQIIYNEQGKAFVVDVNNPDAPPRPIEVGGGQIGKAVTSPKFTEAETNAALFGARAGESDKILAQVGSEYDPLKVNIKGSTENIPGLNILTNKALTGNEQKVDQAQRDFINAILRKESGAAIGQNEFDNARKQYFPQPGDSPDVVQQKTNNRSIAIQGLNKAAGKAAYTPDLPSGKRMSAQQLQAAANAKFGGDLNAAAQAARQHGYTVE